MGWPYHFLELNPDEKSNRRELLAQYAFLSQVSTLAPIIGYGIIRLGTWFLARKRSPDIAYSAVRDSLGSTETRVSSKAIARRWRSLQWWLNGEVVPDWGLRARWIAAIFWILWLLVLCVRQTDHDYLHITKRFGSVAAAQLPLLYMLSMRSRYSPLAIILGIPHEHLIHWHQICGRVIMVLVLLHGTWYINYFIQQGILANLLQHRHPFTGLLSLILIAIIACTSFERMRRWSYRVFIYCHITIGLSIWPILLLHAKPLRLYATESLALFIIDRVLRYMDTVSKPAMLRPVPHTDLVKIWFPMSPKKLARLQAKPGQHVYLAVPESSTCPGMKRLLSNPFTISDVTARELVLVLRTRQGPTTKTLQAYASHAKAHPLVSLEGPYGGFKAGAELAASTDRILLVAGGIGATFILPIYRALQDQLEMEPQGSDRMSLVWALRSAAEAGWATNSEEQMFSLGSNAHIYLTRHGLGGNATDSLHWDEGVEMDTLRTLDGTRGAVKPLTGRPDLKSFVDERFNYGDHERIAVIFCGPRAMGRALRDHVESWVTKGREVLWHEESFGW